MNEPQSLPLFPLPLVVCPSAVIPLHIFEPRYRDLMAWCRSEQGEGRSGSFVIALGHGEKLSEVATVVRLARVLKEYPDGQLDVAVQGLFRCRIAQVRTEHRYQTADCTRFDDRHADWDEALATQAYVLHNQLLKLGTGEVLDPSAYAGRTALSFFMAPTSGLGMAERQQLIEMTDETGRLRFMVRHLQDLIDQITHVHASLASIQGGVGVLSLLRSSRSG